jgi:hypothetical protein
MTNLTRRALSRTLTRTLNRVAIAIAIAALAAAAAPVSAQTPQPPGRADTAAVTAAVLPFFDAMAKHDTVSLRAVLHPGTRFSIIQTGATPGAIATQLDTSFMRTLATRTELFEERMWSPRITIDGPLATLTTPYDFHLAGKWTHCGIDSFTLMQTRTGWRIVGVAYTVQRTDCPPAPAWKDHSE